MLAFLPVATVRLAFLFCASADVGELKKNEPISKIVMMGVSDVFMFSCVYWLIICKYKKK